MAMNRDQLRAARILLHLRQEELAELAKIGLATVRRFEAGRTIGHLHVAAMRKAVEEAGAILIEAGGSLGGRRPGIGVLLEAAEDLPEATLARIDRDNVHEPKDSAPDATKRRRRSVGSG